MACNLSIVVVGILALIYSAESACTDKIPNCSSYGQSMCNDPTYTDWITDNCASFCHKCAPVMPLIPQLPTTTLPAPALGCTDHITNCKDYGASVCTNQDYTDWVSTNCKHFCNKCPPHVPSIPNLPATMAPLPTTMAPLPTPSCTDTLPNCKDYGSSVCSNPDYVKWTLTNCKHFCNKCSVPSLTTAAAIMGSQGCVYDGKVYAEGQTWKDHCKYTCSCETGATGFYRCKDLCLTWNLPDVCSMNPPAPGKCCATPSCPSYINIKYPAGYNEE